MGPQEITHRAWQSFLARMQKRGFGLAKNALPKAAAGRVWCKALPNTMDATVYRVAADKVLAGKFDIFALQETRLGFPPCWNRDPLTGIDVPLIFGKHVDCRDSAVVGNIKYLWEPNRHHELVVIAQAWFLTGERKYLDGCRTLLDSWFEQCPYPLGVNWYSSHEHSVRLANWAVAWGLLTTASRRDAESPSVSGTNHDGGREAEIFCGSAGAAFKQRWLQSVRQHCHFIAGHFSRYSSANNHLFGEYMGLFIGSVVWPCWRESARWKDVAREGLEREAIKQNTADGVNREQAIWYQHEVADMMLLSGLIGRANGLDFSREYWRRLEKLLEFFEATMDVAGNVPMFGDADDAVMVRFSREHDFNVYRSLLATGAVLFERPDFAVKARRFDDKSRWLLGDEGKDRFAELLVTPRPVPDVEDRLFPEGGYYVLGDCLDTPDEIRLTADVGPVGYLSIAAHGHSDALSFTLSIAGTECLIDPGTYAYLGEPEWREYFRGTSAHNTIVVDGENQSLSGGPFIWLRKGNARVREYHAESGSSRLVAEHDGYSRLSAPVLHRRQIDFDKRAAVITVSDYLIGKGEHAVEWSWHFAEAVAVVLEAGRVIARAPGWCVEMTVPDTCGEAIVLRGSQHPKGGWISRRFAQKVPTSTVRWRATSRGDNCWKARIQVIRKAEDGR